MDRAAAARRLSGGRILVFARAPVPGRCKTRLMPALGAAGAARLHRRLVCRTLQACAATGASVELWCAPDTGHGFFHRMRREFGVVLRRQRSGDLGARMGHAIGDAQHRGARHVVVVGTDCPTLKPQDLTAALGLLDRGHDAVVQPALDGGYVLLAARRPLPALRGIAWSSGRELRQTRARFARLGVGCGELAPRWDVDTPADYRRARRLGLV